MTKEQVLKLLSDTYERLQGLVVQPTATNIKILHASLAEIQASHRWVAELNLQEEQEKQEEQNDDGREI